jgi:sugar phosphate isomerase/epimerase
MKHAYSLAHLTALGLSPPQLINAASDAGYDYVGLRLNRTTPEEALYDLIDDRGLMRETKARLADTGVKVWDIEVARMDAPRDHEHYRPFLEAGAELGARHVITQLPDDDRERAIDRFARLCDIANPLGLQCDIEFVSWTQIASLSDAANVVRAVKRPNAGVLVDLLHFDRSHSNLDELKSLPREWLRWAQVCDAPGPHPTAVEGLIHHGRRERLFPGDGGIDVKGILACLPDDATYALEIPGESLTAKIGSEEYVRRALRRAKQLLDGVS